jgi:antitoxin PrlF
MGSTMRARITSKGQVTIPKAVRDRLSLRPGDSLLFDLEGSRTEVRAERRKTIADFAGALPVKKTLPPRKERARAWEMETSRLARPKGPGR